MSTVDESASRSGLDIISWGAGEKSVSKGPDPGCAEGWGVDSWVKVAKVSNWVETGGYKALKLKELHLLWLGLWTSERF